MKNGITIILKYPESSDISFILLTHDSERIIASFDSVNSSLYFMVDELNCLLLSCVCFGDDITRARIKKLNKNLRDVSFTSKK